MNEKARRTQQIISDRGAIPGLCCERLIGLTPGGTPVNYHAKDCHQIETVLLRALLDPPPGGEPGNTLESRVGDLCTMWLRRAGNLPRGSVSYREGYTAAVNVIVAELWGELGLSDDG